MTTTNCDPRAVYIEALRDDAPESDARGSWAVARLGNYYPSVQGLKSDRDTIRSLRQQLDNLPKATQDELDQQAAEAEQELREARKQLRTAQERFDRADAQVRHTRGVARNLAGDRSLIAVRVGQRPFAALAMRDELEAHGFDIAKIVPGSFHDLIEGGE